MPAELGRILEELGVQIGREALDDMEMAARKLLTR